MKNRLVWKIGDTALDMWDTLQQMRHQVDASPDVYLDDNFLRNLNIQQQDWDLADKDDFFACMEQENLLNLTPTDPLEGFTLYEDVKYPNADPPDYLSDLEDAAEEIPAFFKKLNEAKCSEDGRGFAYVKDPSIWEPHATRGFETYLCQWGRPDAATPIHELSHVFHNNDPNRKSHRVYFAWHGDEGKDRVIQRSEAQILITGIKGTMNQPHLCMHNVPLLLLSVHGLKARIMIAHFNPETKILHIKCSKFEQFNGFEKKEKTGSKDGRARPADFEAKRDLFFRWLNPICQGNTYLEDSKDGREFAMARRQGILKLVPYKRLPKRVE